MPLVKLFFTGRLAGSSDPIHATATTVQIPERSTDPLSDAISAARTGNIHGFSYEVVRGATLTRPQYRVDHEVAVTQVFSTVTARIKHAD